MTGNDVRKHSEGDRNVLYLVVDDNYWEVYNYQKSSNGALETYAFYFMIIIPQVKKKYKI